MGSIIVDELIRAAAFKWLKDKIDIYGDVLPRSILQAGFDFHGNTITLVGPKGIWKPKAMDRIPLSITTVCNGPYDDSPLEDGFFKYRYMGDNIYHPDNVGLREAMKKQIPLIYFFGLVPGRYLAIWPVFVTGDDPDTLSFEISADESGMIDRHMFENDHNYVAQSVDYGRRSYITAAIKVRLHQKSFRERVLKAYNEKCAFCSLRHSQLLDAAHIIADGDEFGEPVVENGLSLCKIHHAAFDSNIIGVDPDYVIKVREDILHETDGPMLRYGIQELQDKTIILPHKRDLWPDRERLEIRYHHFRHAV